MMTDVGKRRGGGGFTNQGSRTVLKEGLAAERMVGEMGLQRFPNLEGARERVWSMGLACLCAVWSRSRCNLAGRREQLCKSIAVMAMSRDTGDVMQYDTRNAV
jgi:hypothetical protein